MSILFGAAVVSLITMSGYGETADWPDFPNILVSLPLLAQNQLAFNGVYWSLVHEVHFYLIALAALVVFRRHFTVLFDAVFILWITFFQFGISPDSVLALRMVSFTQYTFFSFYCGCLVFRTMHDINKPILFYHLLMFALYFSLWPNSTFTLQLVILLFILRLFDGKIAAFKPLAPLFFLGQVSYSLYLTHIQIGPRIMGLLSRILPMSNSLIWAFLVLVAMPATLGVAYLFYTYFERPFVNRASGASERAGVGKDHPYGQMN